MMIGHRPRISYWHCTNVLLLSSISPYMANSVSGKDITPLVTYIMLHMVVYIYSHSQNVTGSSHSISGPH